MKIKNIDLKCLKISSILFFVSIFVNKYIFVLCTVIWIANIIWCMSKTLKVSNTSMKEVLEYHDKRTKELQSTNKINGFVYSLAIPMCIIGCIVLILSLISILLV